MRKKILVALSVVFVFGLFASVFALSRTNASAEKTAASCCPMHKQNVEKTASGENQKDLCCGMADCCKDKDSCPMKKTEEKQSAQTMDMSKVTVVKAESDDSCCQPGADCCKGGACCHKKS